METAGGVVLAVLGFSISSVAITASGMPALGRRLRRRAFASEPDWANGEDGEHLVAKFAMSGPGEVSRIHATGVGHQHASERAQVARLERSRLGGQNIVGRIWPLDDIVPL